MVITTRDQGYTFPDIQRHCHLAGTKLYCLVTEAHVCEQLSQSRNMNVGRLGVQPMTC